MLVESIYKHYRPFYEELEEGYSWLDWEKFEWESLHLRYLIYYFIKYDIRTQECFTAYHYKVSYKLYLEKIVRHQLV